MDNGRYKCLKPQTAGATQYNNAEHRLRGNFVTLLCIAGFSDADIAYIMGWEKTKVSEMRRIYVDQNDIIMAQIIKLNSTEV